MKSYKITGGVAKFGPGQIIHLDEKQIARRRHNLEVPAGYKGGASDVIALRGLEFKVGEVIGLPVLEKRLVDIVTPLDPPETEAEKVAVAKSVARAAMASGEKGPATTSSPKTKAKVETRAI